MRKWALEYKPAARAPWVPWVIIVGVPDELKAADVTDRLESWTRWPQWDARREIGSSLRVTDVSNVIGVELDGVPRNSWDDIAPGRVRLTVPLDGAQHARFTRAARASGLSLSEWARTHLGAAADTQL